jgi:hypothetical protein
VDKPKMQRTDANVDRVRTLVRSDQRLSVTLIVEELNMKREAVRQIIMEDLGIRTFSAKIVPRILRDGQKQRRIQISSDLLHNTELFGRVLAVSEIKKCPEGTKIY